MARQRFFPFLLGNKLKKWAALARLTRGIWFEVWAKRGVAKQASRAPIAMAKLAPISANLQERKFAAQELKGALVLHKDLRCYSTIDPARRRAQ